MVGYNKWSFSEKASVLLSSMMIGVFLIIGLSRPSFPEDSLPKPYTDTDAMQILHDRSPVPVSSLSEEYIEDAISMIKARDREWMSLINAFTGITTCAAQKTTITHHDYQGEVSAKVSTVPVSGQCQFTYALKNQTFRCMAPMSVVRAVGQEGVFAYSEIKRHALSNTPYAPHDHLPALKQLITSQRCQMMNNYHTI